MYTHQRLKEFSYKIFKKMGCPDAQAEKASEVLIAADLRGVDSHGVARLAGYVRLWESKRINPTPDISVIHESPSTAVVDGNQGLGLVVGPSAMEIAIEKASNAGTGWVAVKNSNHYGIAGYHAMQALAHDMTGISLTNASPLVAPTYSVERLLGTNPIAVAIPANHEPPFVADFATTTTANGKLEILQRKGKNAPDGWLQDANGVATNDPYTLQNGGALVPLGSDADHGSHKGYCLGAIADIFSGVFSGANYGPWVPPFVSFLPLAQDPVGEGIGHFFGAMRLDAFRPAEAFKNHMDNWIKRFRKSKTVKGKRNVLIPGDPERKMEEKRMKEGIPLLKKVVDDLKTLEEKFKVEL